MRLCNTCRSMVADNAKFCTNCGMPVRVLSDDLTDSVQPATSYYVQPAKKNSGVLAAVIIGVCILLVAGAVGVGITVKSIIDAADAVSGNKVTQAVSEDVLEAEAFGNTTGRTSIDTAVEGYFKAKSIEEFADVVMSPSMLAYFCESLNVGEEDMKAVVGKNYDFKAYSYKNIRVVQKFQLSDSEIDDISEQYYSRKMAAYIDELYEVIVQFDEGHNGDWNTYSSDLYVYRSQGKWYVLVDW